MSAFHPKRTLTLARLRGCAEAPAARLDEPEQLYRSTVRDGVSDRLEAATVAGIGGAGGETNHQARFCS
jgi:hypothetical protein